MQIATLCFLIKENQILLALKKQGFGAGRWNGVGGKLEKGEQIKQAAIRETKEEIGVKVQENNLKEVGFLDFYFTSKPEWNQRVYIFLSDFWQGEPFETREMAPQWFDKYNLPFDKMWCDDKYWLPFVLRGKNIEGEFYFDDSGDGFDKYKIRIF